jgi:hypothetical protein
MGNRDPKLRQWRPIHRYSFTFLGLMFVGMGALDLFAGKLHYRNYWGGPVFTPFIILIGTLVLIGVFIHRKDEK